MNNKRKWVILAVLIVAGVFLWGQRGFDLSRHSIPLEEIKSGGPPKDGIPALDRPRFVSRKQADAIWKDSDRVLGLSLAGEAKAYPIAILNWHEIVNDKLGGKPVVITYCPLCGTGMVFDAVVDGQPVTFGVSGLLYKSDVLLYDRKTDSLWSQIKSEAVVGPLTGKKLHLLPSSHTTWRQWKLKHPQTQVLSKETGHSRDYSRDPYQNYGLQPGLMFPVKPSNNILPTKEWVIGIELEGAVKAYPFSRLTKTKRPIRDRLGNQTIEIEFDSQSKTAVIRDTKGKALPSVVGYWFAWYAFHPDTEVYQEKKK